MTATTGSVTSQDGTTIGYRRFGQGPGLIAVHGGLQAAQNFTRLAAALAGSFTVYVPDRRGRGLSGPPGSRYGLAAECADIAALVQATGASCLFGLSSGALIALQAALAQPAIRRVAAYEPPLLAGQPAPMDWVARYERELAQHRLAAALVTASRGTGTAPPLLRSLPRFAAQALAAAALRQQAGAGEVPLRALVPTMRCDIQLVGESRGTLPDFGSLSAEVLLLGGSRSPAYLRAALAALSGVLPHARQVELAGADHLAPDNDGQPERVARELLAFFGGS